MPAAPALEQSSWRTCSGTAAALQQQEQQQAGQAQCVCHTVGAAEWERAAPQLMLMSSSRLKRRSRMQQVRVVLVM
jgi:hypothetical protein